MTGLAEWPEPDRIGGVEIDPDTAAQLLEDVPAADRLYTVTELIEWFGSMGWPMDEAPDADDLAGYVEHMAAGGYVIGRPPRPLAMNMDLFRFDGMTADQLRAAVDFARTHGWSD